jgi:poly(beta-D-mannuronate) lyase
MKSANHNIVKYQIDLSNNIDAYGNVDTADFLLGCSGDSFYFKEGATNIEQFSNP